MEAKVFSVNEAFCSTTRSVPMLLRTWACGSVNTAGWTNGHLVPRIYVRPPDDGIWDFDFVATTPSGFVPQVVTSIESDILTLQLPKWCKGVRVHSSTNSASAELFPSTGEKEEALYSFIPIPWAAGDAQGGGIDGFPWVFDPSAGRQTAQAGDDSILEEKIRAMIGPRVRIYRQGDPTTDDYLPDRINVVLNMARNQIVRIYRG
jgi:hypothetical protein